MLQHHGVVLINSICVYDTLQCPHCGAHFVSRPGSGARRFMCFPCGNRVTCGSPQCDLHIPTEAKLDYLEGAKVNGKYKEDINLLINIQGSLF